MKNIENMNALNDMAMAEVAGGMIPDCLLPMLPHDDPTVFQPIDLNDDSGRPQKQVPSDYPYPEPPDYPFC